MSDDSIFNKLGSYFKEGLKEAEDSLTGWLSFGSALSSVVSQTKETINELKEIDTLLMEIRKTDSSLSKTDLTRFKDLSFETAGKYGKKAADYLSAVNDALSAGYRNADGFAELSLALQNASGMSAELAAESIKAADESYRLGGNIEKLTALFDGAAAVSDRCSIDMAELTKGMDAAGETAVSLGVGAKETAAALGAMIAATGNSGEEAAAAFTSILFHIRQTADEESGIDAAGLWNFKDACDSLNVSLKETKDGAVSLRDPMSVLEDLSDAYRALDGKDSRKADLIASLDGSADGAQLDALLKDRSLIAEMQKAYANGAGAMAAEAGRTADSWESSLSRLSNTWTNTIGNIADSDFIVSIVNGLNGALTVLDKITNTIGPLASIGAGVGLFAGFKNTGKRIQVYDHFHMFWNMPFMPQKTLLFKGRNVRDSSPRGVL